VDLLTLSACETGLGSGLKEDGREVEGFGVLAQRQGAKAVMATLWKVADRSTGQFMQLLYRLREEKKLTKADALRRVQEMFIRGEVQLTAAK
jgi:CHAT domain-containing protein